MSQRVRLTPSQGSGLEYTSRCTLPASCQGLEAQTDRSPRAGPGCPPTASVREETLDLPPDSRHPVSPTFDAKDRPKDCKPRPLREGYATAPPPLVISRPTTGGGGAPSHLFVAHINLAFALLMAYINRTASRCAMQQQEASTCRHKPDRGAPRYPKN